MEIDLIFKIAVIGLIVSILNQVLSKADKGEYTTLVTMVGIIAVVLMVIPKLSELLEAVKDMMNY